MIISPTVKDFLLYFCVAGIIVLSINTFLIVQNQTRILDNQEKKGLPLTNDTNQKITEIKQLLSKSFSLSQEIK